MIEYKKENKKVEHKNSDGEHVVHRPYFYSIVSLVCIFLLWVLVKI